MEVSIVLFLMRFSSRLDVSAVYRLSPPIYHYDELAYAALHWR